MAVRLTERLWVVGSGFAGLGLTSPADCHVYAYNSGNSWTVVDAGSGLEPDRIALELGSLVGAGGVVEWVLLTHYHADHIGGAASMKQRFGGHLVASQQTADALRTCDEELTGLRDERSMGFYPGDYSLSSCEVDLVLSGSETTLPAGEVEITAIPTPGHCDGHYSYLLVDGEDRVLFTGDSLFAGGRVSVQPLADCRPGEYAPAFDRLLELAPKAMMPGHHGFVLSAASKHIGLALDVFHQGHVPDVRWSR